MQVLLIVLVFGAICCSSNGLFVKRSIRFAPKITTSRPTIVKSATSYINSVKGEGEHGFSFLRDELRPYAMRLHTTDQAPGEGQQKAQTPFTKWETTRMDFMHFLVDSMQVYEALETVTLTDPQLAPLRKTGLERARAIKEDVKWLLAYDRSLTVPEVGAPGNEYSNYLCSVAQESIPRFVCHFYNHYFAHTAGGQRIGQCISAKLLGGKKLQLYSWSALEGQVSNGLASNSQSSAAGGDASAVDPQIQYLQGLKAEVRSRIDQMASKWSPEERRACCEETAECFRYGQALLGYLRGVAVDPDHSHDIHAHTPTHLDPLDSKDDYGPPGSGNVGLKQQ